MRIEHIELIHYGMPLRVPIEVSFGITTRREGLFAVVHAEGASGWGECPIIEGYHYETLTTAWHVARDLLVPRLLGLSFDEPEDIEHAMGDVRGHPFAKSMFEMAGWDLVARRDGLSFAEKLAAPSAKAPRARVKTGISIGIQPDDRVCDVAGRYLEEGYERIKLKVKPGRDVGPARLLRHAFPEIPLMVDANSGYRLDDSAALLAFDELDLVMIEQPLGYDDIFEHSKLRARLRTPLCLDESLHDLHDVRVARALGACDIVNIKPGRVGGWCESRRIHDLCVAEGLGVWIGGMVETELGTAAKIALAALPGVGYHSDIAVSYERFEIAVAEPIRLNRDDSTVTVPTKPGLGIDIDRSAIDHITLRRESFGD